MSQKQILDMYIKSLFKQVPTKTIPNGFDNAQSSDQKLRYQTFMTLLQAYDACTRSWHHYTSLTSLHVSVVITRFCRHYTFLSSSSTVYHAHGEHLMVSHLSRPRVEEFQEFGSLKSIALTEGSISVSNINLTPNHLLCIWNV